MVKLKWSNSNGQVLRYHTIRKIIYVAARPDPFSFSALMVCDRRGNVIASSFILPAEGTVYFSAGSKAWRDGQALVDLRVLPATGARLAVVREPREGLPPDIKEHYKRVQGNLERNQYKLIPGEILTALDILSLAEGKGPTVFLYYGKPHDVLVAASVAHAAGATVTDQATGQDVFPLYLSRP